MRKIYSTLLILIGGSFLTAQISPAVKSVNQLNLNNTIHLSIDAKDADDFEFYEKEYQGVNIPNSSITDSNGNTYITGTSSDTDSPQGNMFTIKYDSDGGLAWEKREETVDFSVEQGYAITLDENENPVVSGIVWNGDNMDIRTSKYNKSTGETIWSSNFDGGYDGLDYPKAITVDSENNILIGGLSYSVDSTENVGYVTLKYNSDGELLWSKIDENDVQGVWIQPYAIATDNNGNVVITGYGASEDLYQVYYTIKYSAEGNLLWKKKYEYDAGGNPTNSIASDVKFDENGNCFVTGTFNDSSGESLIGTIKYDTDGEELWIKTYKNPDHTTLGYELEISGNTLYVAGLHRSWEPFSGSTLVSYSTDDGTQNWVQESENLIINGDAIGTYVHLEMNNSLPVISIWGQNDTDNIVQIRKYNLDGTLNFEKNYTKELSGTYSLSGLTGMGIDQNNSVYITFSPRYTSLGEAYEIAKFEEDNTNWAWDELYSNMGASDINYTKALPLPNGNMAVAGYFISIDETENVLQNFFLINYNPDGEIIWEKLYTPDNGYTASRIDFNVDEEGNIYTLLTPNPFDVETAITLQKVSADGNMIWETQKDLISPEGYLNPLIDENGNVYIAGISHESETEYQPYFNIIKYNSSGEELWNNFISSGNDEDNVYYISSDSIDNVGNLILSGQTGIGSFFSQTVNSTVLKVNAEGELSWIQPMVISGWNSGATGLFIDDENQIFVSGWKENQTDINQGEMITMKYSPEGELIWDNSYNESGRRIRSYGIKPTSDNGFIVTGFSNHIATQINRVIAVKYNSDGEMSWNRNSADFQFYRDFYVDDLDNVYILNQEYSTTNPKRIYYSAGPFTIAKIMRISSGGEMDEEIFMGDELSPLDPGDLIPFEDGRLLIGSQMSNEMSHFSGIKFFETTHEILATNDPGAEEFSGNWLGQNYPNPSGNLTKIPFRIAQSGRVRVKLYDSRGRLVRVLANQNYSSGEHYVEINLSGLSKGIYFYQLNSASGFTQSKKLIVN